MSQGKHDYPWGVLGVLALRHNDAQSARCWLRETAGLRHTDRWTVTDEVAHQIIARSALAPAASDVACA